MKGDRWLVAVGAGRWQVPGIRAAQVAGLKVMAVDGVQDAPGMVLGDRSLTVDIRQPESVIEAIDESGIQPSGAIAFCNEAGMVTAARLREHFDLPGARMPVVMALTNKGVQRRLWTKAGLPCPMWALVRFLGELPAAMSSISLPAIVKPVDSAGSRGITVVREKQSALAAFEFAMSASQSKEVIVESFVVGMEYTVETFTHRGNTHVLAITAKKKVVGTSDTVAYELATAYLSGQKRQEVAGICTRALAALGFEDGPGHTELLLSPAGEICLVESAGRGGGFMVADGIVPAVSGFDMATACALQAVGMEPLIPTQIRPRSAVLRFIPSKPGKVKSIEGFAEKDNVAGVKSEPMVSVGQEVGRATSDADRMAFILSVADTIEEAQQMADEKERRIKIAVA